MKNTIRVIIKGFAKGTFGADIVSIFDKDGNGKVSIKEIKEADISDYISAIVSTGTSILTFLYFTK